MGSARQIVEGMQLIMRHRPDGDATVDAEHEEIYVVGPAPGDMHEKDVATLRKLGWLWDGSSWMHFTT